MIKERSEWPLGPWTNEPDRVEWKDEETGLMCLMVRNLGAWCGYVGVPPSHAQHGKGYDDVEVDVHGGLTYAGACSGHICHTPVEGEEENLWWLGFDCNHYDDLSPSLMRYAGSGTYKDLAYVKAECKSLAAQLRSKE